jgi:predicted anti-sigma-YlaC factor YlaD
MLLSCRTATRLASKRLDRGINPVEHLGLLLHLTFCAACRKTLRQFQFVRRAASQLRRRATASPD